MIYFPDIVLFSPQCRLFFCSRGPGGHGGPRGPHGLNWRQLVVLPGQETFESSQQEEVGSGGLFLFFFLRKEENVIYFFYTLLTHVHRCLPTLFPPSRWLSKLVKPSLHSSRDRGGLKTRMKVSLPPPSPYSPSSPPPSVRVNNVKGPHYFLPSFHSLTAGTLHPAQ